MKIIFRNSALVFQEQLPGQVATPVIVITGNSVTITCATTGATIYYTLDGSTPTSSSTQYSSAFTLNSACTIKAIGIKTGSPNSGIASQAFEPAGSWVTLDITPTSDSFINSSGDIQSISGSAYVWVDVNAGEMYKVSCQLSGAVAIVTMNDSTVISSIVRDDNPEGMDEYGLLTDYPMTMPANCNKLGVSTRSQAIKPIVVKKFVLA